MADPTGKLIRTLKSNYCGLVKSAGVTHMIKHLAGSKGESSSCRLVPAEVRHMLRNEINQCSAKKRSRNERRYCHSRHSVEEGNYTVLGYYVESGDVERSDKDLTSGKPSSSRRSQSRSRSPQGIPPITPIVESYGPSRKKNADAAVARFFYACDLPFSAADTPSFIDMTNLLSNYGYKPPTAYELSGKLLRDEVEKINSIVNRSRKQWERNGCTIMADSWKNNEGQTLINFYVSCSRNIVFLKSTCVEESKMSGEYLANKISEVIDKVGPELVVQVVTAQEDGFKIAGVLLMDKYKHLYWSACSAHICDLICQDIEKLPFVSQTIAEAKNISRFIYGRSWALTRFRSLSHGKCLIMSGSTKSITNVVNLGSMLDNFKLVQRLINSPDFKKHTALKSHLGQRVIEIVNDQSFRQRMKSAVLLTEPICKLIRFIDGELPTMAHLYEELAKVKQIIASVHLNKPRKYESIWKIIDRHWKNELVNDLHRAALQLNPEHLINGGCKVAKEFGIDEDGGKHRGLLYCIPKMSKNAMEAADAFIQLGAFRSLDWYIQGDASALAAQKGEPANWWHSFGGQFPELQRIALRILSQTTSSIGCKRNQSQYDQFHIQSKNCLTAKMLNDLVYVHYNLRLAHRNKELKSMDPISCRNYLLSDPIDTWLNEDDDTWLNEGEGEAETNDERNRQWADEEIDEPFDSAPSANEDPVGPPHSWEEEPVPADDELLSDEHYYFDFKLMESGQS